MALIARLAGVRISDPSGTDVVIDVSFVDDTILDPREEVVASHSFAFYPGQSRASIRDSVVTHGRRVAAAIAARDAFALQFPVGTEINID